MSLFVPMDLTCPNCGAVVTIEAVGSVNADRRPDLRDEIIENSFQIATCNECSHSFRLEPDFNYLDVGRGQWIAALPPSQLRDHLEIADDKSAVFDISYGKDAPVAAQTVGKGLKLRVVFGWPAMREKLILRDHDLDDVAIEVAKLDILRTVPESPMAEGVDLRVVDASDDKLTLLWVDSASEEAFGGLEVDRAIYDKIVGDMAPWQAVYDQLNDSPFVDIQKLFMGEGRAD